MFFLAPHTLAAWESGPLGYGLCCAAIGLPVAMPCYLFLERRSKSRKAQGVNPEINELFVDIALGIGAIVFGALGLGGVIGSVLQLIEWGSRKISES